MMVEKKSIKATPKQPDNDPNALRVTAGDRKKSREAMLAELAYDPAVRAVVGARDFINSPLGERGLTESLDALRVQVEEVKAGDLAVAEKTLIAQANTLDAIFNELARRTALNMGEYLKATETYLRLALKAQAQCRATLETLANIKNPPVVYARQANIGYNQQVNNGAAPIDGVRARKNENPPNELLEENNG